MKQTTSNLLMVRPARFSFNPETAVNNAFQKDTGDLQVAEKAQKEFEDFAQLLRRHAIDLTIVDDSETPATPDSIFPNNWFSTHPDGTVFLYPMFAPNRRLERKPKVLDKLKAKFTISTVTDLSFYEQKERFLEGTGSMILDRAKLIAYACRSPRTSEEVMMDFCARAGYRAVLFHAYDRDGGLIYHTNVMMCVAEKYATVSLDSIRDAEEKETLVKSLERNEKEIIPISLDQVYEFAGNMLQVNNSKEEQFLIMSSRAYHALTDDQKQRLESFNSIIHAPLTTIENNGGGSARCMLAEIFLPIKPV